MKSTDFIEGASIVLLFSALCIVWHFVWVKPHDEMLETVSICMDDIDDYTKSGFEKCHKKFLNDKALLQN